LFTPKHPFIGAKPFGTLPARRPGAPTIFTSAWLPVHPEAYSSDSNVVQNMPGMASTVAANDIYEVAKPDGLTKEQLIKGRTYEAQFQILFAVLSSLGFKRGGADAFLSR
jgi:hypothetical protein